MSMKAGYLSLLAAAGLVACAPSVEWHKAGATPEDFRLAQRECVSRAQDYDFAFDERSRDLQDLGAYDTAERRGGSARGDVYSACMRAHGWRRERVPPQGSQTQKQ